MISGLKSFHNQLYGMYQGSNFDSNFGRAAISGPLTNKMGGERPAHSLLINIVILANLTSLSTSV
jgi:hypothetical protein